MQVYDAKCQYSKAIRGDKVFFGLLYHVVAASTIADLWERGESLSGRSMLDGDFEPWICLSFSTPRGINAVQITNPR